MALPRYENENQLRQLVKAAWGKPFSLGHALIVKSSNLEELAASFRKFASELGARFIALDIEGDTLPDDQVELLKRKGPRIVLISGLENLSEAELAKFPDAINAGGRAMPVFPVIEEGAKPDAFGGDEDEDDTAPPFDEPAAKEDAEEAELA
ncbi:hypothetical protein [Erythrobacter aureus]|uniref:Uncharacterized protein n=1 Tax=Erythrobacter aureus TaxID=2182384 RepID=A0A345YJ32_9SPHN|nr:hypothetical protein [Erythrobacter aureus]AXK43934.1 hypothetical protein DVR09_15885 [Erythrobacter aureus]